MKIRYTSPAAADLEAALAYLASRSPAAARKLVERLDAIELQLQRFPRSGARTRLSWLRRCVMSPLPYLLFYEAADTELIVHAIRHGARDPASMPDQP